MTMHRRWVRHCYDARRGSEFHFHRAIRLYGCDAWIHEVLQESILTREDAKDAEREWIQKLRTNESTLGYNMTKGGDGVQCLKFSEASRKKMSDARRRRPPPSEETKRRISESLKGRVVSTQTREKIREHRTGTQLSPESRVKVSQASKERFADPVFREKHRQATMIGVERGKEKEETSLPNR
jgi:group I intron endonuclease